MFVLAALGMDHLFNFPQKKQAKPREIPGNRTTTMRALSDLGESIASSVHAIYSPVRLYLCVAMEPKPEALAAQKKADKHVAAGVFEVDELWSAAAVNARWARRAVLTDAQGKPLERAIHGARGMTDVGAKEAFFEFNALDAYPEAMYLSNGATRIRVR